MRTSVGRAIVCWSLGITLATVACNADTQNANSGGTDSSGNNGSGSTNGSSSSSATTGGIDYDACFACGDDVCAAEASDCDSTTGCRGLLDCIFGCDQADGDCQLGCVPSGQESAPEVQAASTYYTCTIFGCLDECTPDVDTSTSSSVGGASATSTTSSTNAAASANNGALTASSTTGEAVTSTSGGGSGGSTTVSGVNWISFDGSWADPSMGANGALGISGSMYAFGDSCASVSYDETTRCVSGYLCDPGTDFANWGMAIGFDFYNTGDLGSPANTKYPWGAGTVGAMGIAWVVSGSAPGLQAWITNMDPTWGGACSADDCGIDGPPDGTTAVAIGSQDAVYFSSLQKDDWGGSGTVYTFDSSNILALQFKLAAVVSGAVSFDFCIDQVGIIL